MYMQIQRYKKKPFYLLFIHESCTDRGVITYDSAYQADKLTVRHAHYNNGEALDKLGL